MRKWKLAAKLDDIEYRFAKFRETANNNLKTQKDYIQCLVDLIDHLGLEYHIEILPVEPERHFVKKTKTNK
jgi:hypothetical protein